MAELTRPEPTINDHSIAAAVKLLVMEGKTYTVPAIQQELRTSGHATQIRAGIRRYEEEQEAVRQTLVSERFVEVLAREGALFMETHLQEYIARIETAEENCERLSEESIQLTSELDAARNTRSVQDETINRQTVRLEDLQRSVTELQKLNDQLRNELEQARVSEIKSQAKLEAAESHQAQTQNALDAARKRISELELENTASNNRCSELKEQLDGSDQERKTLREQLAESEELRQKEEQESGARDERLVEQISQLSGSVQEQASAISRLNEKLARMETRLGTEIGTKSDTSRSTSRRRTKAKTNNEAKPPEDPG